MKERYTKDEAKILLHRLEQRAKNRDIECSLTVEQYYKLLNVKRCQLSGKTMCRKHDNSLSVQGTVDPAERTQYHEYKQVRANHVTLDRFDNTKGYHYDNCLSVTRVANLLKNRLWEQPDRSIMAPRRLVYMMIKLWWNNFKFPKET